MERITYFSATELLVKARHRMVPLENQKEAQKKIASLIARHLNKIQALEQGMDPEELVSASAFLVGSTGSGKTFIIKSLAEVCGLEFAALDASAITQQGTKGRNLSHALMDILEAKPEFFQGGILCIDEADKIFYTGNAHYDAFSPMQDYLKLLEGGNYIIATERKMRSINLDRTLILFAGACSRIIDVLKERHNMRPSIGFASANNPPSIDVEDYSALVKLEDLITYGMMPELASRINTVIAIPKIDKAGYHQLLIDPAKTSALNRFRNQFGMRGVTLEITPEAVERIAEMCVERNVGARSINAILSERLSEAYNVADDDLSCGKVVLQTDGHGELQTVCLEGERCRLQTFLPLRLEENDFSLADELGSEEGINTFCHVFCRPDCLQTIHHEPLFYLFLQVAARVLASAANEDGQRFSNLLKLTYATRKVGKRRASETPFDRICEKHMKKLRMQGAEEGSQALQNRYLQSEFLHYYFAFCAEQDRHRNASSILIEAVKTAGKYYVPDSELCSERKEN